MRHLLIAVLALACLSVAPASAQPVDLALVLAVDVSESVDSAEYELQHEGIARAVEDEGFLAALANGEHRAIALAVMEWSDRDRQVITVDWARIADAESAAEFASRVRATTRTSNGLTAIGDALLAARAALGRVPWPATRRVVDLSGDGMANVGAAPQQARDLLVAEGITINALPILSEEPWLDAYYNEYVIGGPGAFIIAAEDFRSFADAMRTKLFSEIVALPPRTSFAALRPSAGGRCSRPPARRLRCSRS